MSSFFIVYISFNRSSDFGGFAGVPFIGWPVCPLARSPDKRVNPQKAN
jgi:hypothetical protein